MTEQDWEDYLDLMLEEGDEYWDYANYKPDPFQWGLFQDEDGYEEVVAA